jgi:hypothetical protein
MTVHYTEPRIVLIGKYLKIAMVKFWIESPK